MSNKENLLYNIFIKNSKGELTDEIDKMNCIKYFFTYIQSDEISQELKIQSFKELTKKMNVNRYIIEYFSSYENKSIYLYLFELFTNPKSSTELKEAILKFIDELRINVMTGKDIYDYLFQKLSQIYRGEIAQTAENVNQYLTLLNSVLGDIEGIKIPKNYFACSGKCKFAVDLSEDPVPASYSFSFILNFRISNYVLDENKKEGRKSSLIKIYFNNKTILSIDLQYPYSIIVEEIRKEFIKMLPNDEWINLIVTMSNIKKKNCQLSFFVNGENHVNYNKLDKFLLTKDTYINYIEFFTDFYGEVSSIAMISQQESGPPGIHNITYLSEFKNFKEGLWKKKLMNKFLLISKKYGYIDKKGAPLVHGKDKLLQDSFVFIFTPYNIYKSNFVDSTVGDYQMRISGTIRNHILISYQKKITLITNINNFYPIAEMFLMHPQTLSEENFSIYLNIFGNLLNARKHNLKRLNKSKIFRILSIFFEKYPNQVFTEKVLNAFFALGKTLFSNSGAEKLCSEYFTYILLNEKILTKYSQSLQSNFWTQLELYCQSDITQIESFFNINKICLILRFYDKNKYQEMCCKEHLNMIKENFIGSTEVMNPQMCDKIASLKQIMDAMIGSQDAPKVISLFKLLTLDLSPCLSKFILNIFTKALGDKKITDVWKKNFLLELINAQYEVVLVNAFLHSLPDIRIQILRFIYQIHRNIMLFSKNGGNFKILERMLKTCLLPDSIFYEKKIKPNENRVKKPEDDFIQEKKVKDDIIEDEMNKINEKKEKSDDGSEENDKKENIVGKKKEGDDNKEEKKEEKQNENENKPVEEPNEEIEKNKEKEANEVKNEDKDNEEKKKEQEKEGENEQDYKNLLPEVDENEQKDEKEIVEDNKENGEKKGEDEEENKIEEHKEQEEKKEEEKEEEHKEGGDEENQKEEGNQENKKEEVSEENNEEIKKDDNQQEKIEEDKDDKNENQEKEEKDNKSEEDNNGEKEEKENNEEEKIGEKEENDEKVGEEKPKEEDKEEKEEDKEEKDDKNEEKEEKNEEKEDKEEKNEEKEDKNEEKEDKNEEKEDKDEDKEDKDEDKNEEKEENDEEKEGKKDGSENTNLSSSTKQSSKTDTKFTKLLEIAKSGPHKKIKSQKDKSIIQNPGFSEKLELFRSTNKSKEEVGSIIDTGSSKKGFMDLIKRFNVPQEKPTMTFHKKKQEDKKPPTKPKKTNEDKKENEAKKKAKEKEKEKIKIVTESLNFKAFLSSINKKESQRLKGDKNIKDDLEKTAEEKNEKEDKEKDAEEKEKSEENEEKEESEEGKEESEEGKEESEEGKEESEEGKEESEKSKEESEKSKEESEKSKEESEEGKEKDGEKNEDKEEEKKEEEEDNEKENEDKKEEVEKEKEDEVTDKKEEEGKKDENEEEKEKEKEEEKKEEKKEKMKMDEDIMNKIGKSIEKADDEEEQNDEKEEEKIEKTVNNIPPQKDTNVINKNPQLKKAQNSEEEFDILRSESMMEFPMAKKKQQQQESLNQINFDNIKDKDDDEDDSVNKKEDIILNETLDINDIENFMANNLMSHKNEIMIIKDEEMEKYIENLYSFFILWALGISNDTPLEGVSLDNAEIKNINAIEYLFVLNYNLRNKKLILKSLEALNKLTKKEENCFQIYYSSKIYASIFDLTFENYKLKGEYEEKCSNLGNNIISAAFIHAFGFSEKVNNKVYSPGKFIETIFIWGDKIIEKNKTKKDLLFDFIYAFFEDCLNQFKIKYETKIVLDCAKETSFKIENNYFLKNYIYFINFIFIFAFKYRLDFDIHRYGVNYLYPENRKITIPNVLVESMRMNETISETISSSWKDFPLVNDMLFRARTIWSKKSLYRLIKLDKLKKAKTEKYKYILENIILNKKKKNVYLSELEFLCYEDSKEDSKDDYKFINPLIRELPLAFMCILTKLNYNRKEKDFFYWLKELKSFLRYLIIASSNLIKINQTQDYNKLQDHCLEAIAGGLCFLYNLYIGETICKEKIEQNLCNLFLLCFKIMFYQLDFKKKKKKIVAIVSKDKNDLQLCAVCRLFSEIINAQSENPIITFEKLESLKLDNKNFRNEDILTILTGQDFTKSFWENPELKKRLIDTFFSLNLYKAIVDKRYSSIPHLYEKLDFSYKKSIMTILPQYEAELALNTNNYVEKSLKIRNLYKSSKKSVFIWQGSWCKRDMFYKDQNMKSKLVNHYTRNYMRPVLTPIIDVSYYLPEFSHFKPDNLFYDNLVLDKDFKLDMNIAKELKEHEQKKKENEQERNKKNILKDNYLSSIYKKSNPDLYNHLKKIANDLEVENDDKFSVVKTVKKDQTEYFLSCLVKPSHHIKGVVFISKDKLNFKVFLDQKNGREMNGTELKFTDKDFDYDPDRKTCFGSYFVYHPKDKNLYKISINYSDIKWIFKRKYFYRNTGIEIYTVTNKAYYFNFKNIPDRDKVMQKLLEKINEPDKPIPIVDDLKEEKIIIGYESLAVSKKREKKPKNLKLSSFIGLWKNWKISNYEMLMLLNILGNRSYNDITQYPVFPWTMTNYEDPLIVNIQKLPPVGEEQAPEAVQPEIVKDYLYRDLSLPMGMLEISPESIKRKNELELNYETLKEENDENSKPYLFGSNYSSPIYVCSYLVRIFPFTHISIEMQGKGFDQADRLFQTVKGSFFNSTSQKGDVRELVPEFFYLPEMFLNINKLKLGTTEEGKEVNNVETPCKNDPYTFVLTMKKVLEGENVSANLTNWIDLIFGYKAKGKEAENAKNVFKEMAYQESIDIGKFEEKEAKLREVEFGLIPNQLMVKECSKKDKPDDILKKGKEITDPNCVLKSILCKQVKENNEKNEPGNSVVEFGILGNNNSLQVILDGKFMYEKRINCKGAELYEEKNIPYHQFNKPGFGHRMNEFYNPKMYTEKAIKFCKKSQVIIFGGLYDGTVAIYSVDLKMPPIQATPFSDKQPVVAIGVPQDEEYAFFGNTIGNVRMMKMSKNPQDWRYLEIKTDHFAKINYIHCSSELNLWCSASSDGIINLYTYPLCKLVRSIKLPSDNCEYVFLSDSPLPVIIAISNENSQCLLYVYSINGKLLFMEKESYLLSSPLLMKDLTSCEYLIYIVNNSVVIRNIPTLEVLKKVENLFGIFGLCLSEDLKTLYGIDKSGTQTFVINEK